jgi:hypothetical protein
MLAPAKGCSIRSGLSAVQDSQGGERSKAAKWFGEGGAVADGVPSSRSMRHRPSSAALQVNHGIGDRDILGGAHQTEVSIRPAVRGAQAQSFANLSAVREPSSSPTLSRILPDTIMGGLSSVEHPTDVG